jgi:hypothetical protein
MVTVVRVLRLRMAVLVPRVLVPRPTRQLMAVLARLTGQLMEALVPPTRQHMALASTSLILTKVLRQLVKSRVLMERLLPAAPLLLEPLLEDWLLMECVVRRRMKE